MKTNVRRIFAASITALALVGVGLSSASAADTVTDPNYVATPKMADADTALPVTGTIGFEQQVVGILDLSDYEIKYPIPAGATGAWVFVSPRGQESTPSQWNAKSVQVLTPGGLMLPNFSLTNQGISGTGSPQGINAVKAAGGNYSIGIAYTKDNGINLIPNSLYFGHITVTAGSGDWTYTETQAAGPALTPTTTTLTAPATAVAGVAVSLSATVAPAGATGSVEYYDGATLLGASPVGTPYDVALGLSAGSHQLTAKYLGDATHEGSTSAAQTVSVTVAPITTTTTVTATSATGYALKPAVISATVVAAGSTPTGSVTFTGSVDGGAVQTFATVPVNASGTASLTTSALTVGAWSFNASYTPTGSYVASASTTPATLALTAVPTDWNSSEDDQTVIVEIPTGSIEITTPYTPANPFDLGTAVFDQATSTYSASAAFPKAADAPIKITDTRSGQPGFTAQVVSSAFTAGAAANQTFPGSHAGLTNLAATVPAGNQFNINALTLTNNAAVTPGLGSAKTFASYAAGNGTGTVDIRGTLGIANVPTSVLGGNYTATVTFTAF